MSQLVSSSKTLFYRFIKLPSPTGASFRDTRTSRVGLGTSEHAGVALRAGITLHFWHIFLLSLGTLLPTWLVSERVCLLAQRVLR